MPKDTSDKVGCLGAIFRLFGIVPSKGNVAKGDELPYRMRENFLSAAELAFYQVLVQAVGNRFSINNKVRLWDVMYVEKCESKRSFENKISSKHIDYLLCERDSVRPVLAIELDDSSHKRPDRAERDDFVDKAMEAAGLPILHIRASSSYNATELSKQIELALQTSLPVPKPPPVPLQTLPSNKQSTACPKCQASMVERKASKGSHAGKRFWACSNYQNCRGILPID